MINLLRQMLFIQKIKKWLESFAVKIPLSPNQITISAVLCALLGFLAVYSNQLLLGFVLFLVSGFFDALDGAVARAKKQKTSFGFFLDGVSDRIVEFLFILAFFFLPFGYIAQEITLLILLFFSLTIPYIKSYSDHSRALSHGKALKMGGILERSERLILFYAIFIAVISGLDWFASVLLLTAVLLSFVTFVQRVYYVASSYSKKL